MNFTLQVIDPMDCLKSDINNNSEIDWDEVMLSYKCYIGIVNAGNCILFDYDNNGKVEKSETERVFECCKLDNPGWVNHPSTVTITSEPVIQKADAEPEQEQIQNSNSNTLYEPEQNQVREQKTFESAPDPYHFEIIEPAEPVFEEKPIIKESNHHFEDKQLQKETAPEQEHVEVNIKPKTKNTTKNTTISNARNTGNEKILIKKQHTGTDIFFIILTILCLIGIIYLFYSIFKIKIHNYK